MYSEPAPVAAATDALWRFLRDALRGERIAGVPDALDRTIAYDAAWRRDDLLLAQTCGYPFATRLRGTVRLVATPVYDLPGCDGPFNASLLVVGRDACAKSLADLRGARVAINQRDSNSGANLLRAAVAPLSVGGRFFGVVEKTGSHRASMAAVADGRADLAAIDCVTFGLTARFEPARVEALRILGRTPSGPGLPFITRGSASDEEIAALRRALAAAIAAPELAAARDALSLVDIAILSEADYAVLPDMERAAAALGYRDIA